MRVLESPGATLGHVAGTAKAVTAMLAVCAVAVATAIPLESPLAWGELRQPISEAVLLAVADRADDHKVRLAVIPPIPVDVVDFELAFLPADRAPLALVDSGYPPIGSVPSATGPHWIIGASAVCSGAVATTESSYRLPSLELSSTLPTSMLHGSDYRGESL